MRPRHICACVDDDGALRKEKPSGVPLKASYVGPRHPVDALLEKYAQDILDTEPPSASASDDEFRPWRAHVRERATTLIGAVRGEDEPHRNQTARQLAGLRDRKRVWWRD